MPDRSSCSPHLYFFDTPVHGCAMGGGGGGACSSQIAVSDCVLIMNV